FAAGGGIAVEVLGSARGFAVHRTLEIVVVAAAPAKDEGLAVERCRVERVALEVRVARPGLCGLETNGQRRVGRRASRACCARDARRAGDARVGPCRGSAASSRACATDAGPADASSASSGERASSSAPRWRALGATSASERAGYR